MSEVPIRLKHLTARLRRALARPRPRHWTALASISVAALGLLSLRSVDLPSPRPLEAHNRLRIEVVPPVEPDIEPGSRMDVGELVDGFRYIPPPPAMVEPIAYEDYDGWEDWREPPPPARYVREPHREEGGFYPPPPPRPEPRETVRPPRRESRWFGFDEPRRDYRAEREERRARAEARAEARDRRWEDREREWRDRRYEDDGPWREPPPPDDRWD